MADNFMHDSGQVEEAVSKIQDYLDNYKMNVEKLTSLLSEIETSAAWKDQNVKTAFISTAKSYIDNYKIIEKAIKKYKKFLNNKSKGFEKIESQFS